MIENKIELADNEKGAEPCSTTNRCKVYMAYRSFYSAFSVYSSFCFMSFVTINAICSIMCLNGAFSLFSVVSKLKWRLTLMIIILTMPYECAF